MHNRNSDRREVLGERSVCLSAFRLSALDPCLVLLFPCLEEGDTRFYFIIFIFIFIFWPVNSFASLCVCLVVVC